jgi:methyl-accepting chemotaxis protein
MKLLAKFNLILLLIFGAGGVLIAALAYQYLIGSAQRQVMQDAQLMMASAQSMRDYTSSDLVPLLLEVPKHKVRFLAETVPAYAATTTFKNLRAQYPDYSYREATLNPTNPEDRATDWESDIIREMQDRRNETQTHGERSTPNGPALYLANPIVVKHSCLECHSVPSAAPKAMLTVYGSNNGFGWKENDVVGAQIISVPSSVPLEQARAAFRELLFFLALTMILAIVALDLGVYWFVIHPLRLVSVTADRVSRGEGNVMPLTPKGKDEIALVTASFNRMQLSLARALEMLEGDAN